MNFYGLLKEDVSDDEGVEAEVCFFFGYSDGYPGFVGFCSVVEEFDDECVCCGAGSPA